MKSPLRQLKKAQLQLGAEMNKQIDIIYSAAAIVLWRNGWRTLRIMRRFVTTMEVWDECAEHGTHKSMLQMLEEETGIELQISGFDKSYHDLDYLDGSHWDGHIPTVWEQIYMHQQQRKWMAPLVLAAFCISLHRDEHFGSDRIGRFISQIDQLRQEIGEDPEDYTNLLESETDITHDMIWDGLKKERDRMDRMEAQA